MLHGKRPHDDSVTLIMMAKQPGQVVLLLNGLVHCCSRACESADFIRLLVQPTALSQARLHELLQSHILGEFLDQFLDLLRLTFVCEQDRVVGLDKN